MKSKQNAVAQAASAAEKVDLSGVPGLRDTLDALIRGELARVTGAARPAAVLSVRLMAEQRVTRRMLTADAGRNMITLEALDRICREAMRTWLITAHYPIQHTADLLDAVLVAAGHEPSLPARCPDVLTAWQKVIIGLLFIEGMPIEQAAAFLGMPPAPLRHALAEAMSRVQNLGLRPGGMRPWAEA